ncbi:MAG: hypothetical protein H6618_02610 [Deltaproteobacteria bacterium]|nr:hypothetical protein [Deltaproteobacteria bacterium]
MNRSRNSRQDGDKEARDDWEALKILLDSMPSLKQRVLHKLRELKNRKENEQIKVSRKEQMDYMREKHRNQGKNKS